jgi:tRNA (adenine37-N6)-methyltransferase
MNIADIVYRPIGVIRSAHTQPEITPIQPVFAEGCRGRVELLREFAAGLKDLEGFSHIYLIYHLHRAPPPRLLVMPFLQDVEHGIFATRTPCRPNPIGMSIVRLLRVAGCTLEVDELDVLDGTPLLDIKPYTARFDRVDETRNGWQDGLDEKEVQARGRRMPPTQSARPTALTVAVLGASANPERYSHKAVAQLLAHGHTVFPVNPGLSTLLEHKVYATLADLPAPPHTVTLYVGPERSTALADAILAARPRRVIFNPGSENPVLSERLKRNGIEVLDACTLVLLTTGQFYRTASRHKGKNP